MFDIANKMILPIFEDGAVMPLSMAKEAIDSWAKSNDINNIEYLDSGAWGHAFKFNGDRVVKITVSVEEALFAYEAMFESPNGYVPIHSVEKVNDTVFIIVMDLLNRPEDLLQHLYDLDLIIDDAEYEYHKQQICELEHIIHDKTVRKLFRDIHDIVNESNKFRMTDIHADNIGFDFDTGEVLIFDQPLHIVSHVQKVITLKMMDEIELFQ